MKIKTNESKEANSNRHLKDSLDKFATLALLWKRFLTQMLIVAANGILLNKDDIKTSHIVWRIKRWWTRRGFLVVFRYNKATFFQTVFNDRSSHQRCSMKKGVLRNFTKFTGKHLCLSLFFDKVAGQRPLDDCFCNEKSLCFNCSYKVCYRMSSLEQSIFKECKI